MRRSRTEVLLNYTFEIFSAGHRKLEEQRSIGLNSVDIYITGNSNLNKGPGSPDLIDLKLTAGEALVIGGLVEDHFEELGHKVVTDNTKFKIKIEGKE